MVDFSVPSADLLTQFTAFFKLATFARSGDATVNFTLPREMHQAILELCENDGLALNVTVHSTRLPDGMEMMAGVLGIEDLIGGGDETREVGG